jgi:hypothetical protein
LKEANSEADEAQGADRMPSPTESAKRRLGFLKGEFTVPDDFNEMGREEIEAMFYGNGTNEPA